MTSVSDVPSSSTGGHLLSSSAACTTTTGGDHPPLTSREMGEGPILLSLPSHVHVEDVYSRAGGSKKGAFEVRNDGPDPLVVELASRGGGEIEFWREMAQDRKEPSKSKFGSDKLLSAE